MPTTKKWIENKDISAKVIAELANAININPVLAKVLLKRGVKTFEQAKTYFRPKLEDLHDPFLMKDMEVAVKRLTDAFESNENILVYGDYDVDGTTAVATMFSFLKAQEANVAYYIPDRYREGYGLSTAGIDFAHDNEVTLMISLDCGIKAVEKVAYASQLGIDIIICDHHLPASDLPKATAILDPKRAGCAYPFKELSGCGVGFKLIQALCSKLNLPEHMAYEYLDLVAVSIAADIVAVTGENRTLAYYGLEKINFNPKPGLKALLQLANVTEKIEIAHLVFQISPKINAAGRIDHAHLAVKLLIAKNEDEAQVIAKQVSDKNNRRKDFDQGITKEAIALIEGDEQLKKAKSTVLFQQHWHKGVIGIVASRCIEKYYRPTVILTASNGQATGSARSVHGFDVYKAISKCAKHLTQFGGHKYAAGLTMPIENIGAFQEMFEEEVTQTIQADDLIPKINIDSYLHLDQITPNFFNVLSQMDPYGPENMQPVFAARNIELVEDAQILKKEHLRFIVKDADGNKAFTAIAFGQADAKAIMSENNNFEMAFTIQQNEYKGHKSLQLVVKDIRSL